MEEKKNVPSLGKVVVIEFVTLIIILLSLVVTVFLVLGGLVFAILFFISKKNIAKPWQMIGELWTPIGWHYVFLGWIIKNALARKTKKPVFKLTKHEEIKTTSSYDPTELIEAIILNLDVAYMGTVLVYLIVGLLLPGAAIHYVAINQKTPAVKPTPKASIAYQPTEIQLQEQDFKPFIEQQKADELRTKSGVNNFALIEDTGEIRYSQNWTVSPSDPEWHLSNTPRITSQKIEGTAVTFVDDRNNTIVLNTDQPFAFENAAKIVYIFKDGQLFQAIRDKVNKKSVQEFRSNAKPNPKLTIL